jgi:hypothetical protein
MKAHQTLFQTIERPCEHCIYNAECPDWVHDKDHLKCKYSQC